MPLGVQFCYDLAWGHNETVLSDSQTSKQENQLKFGKQDITETNILMHDKN